MTETQIVSLAIGFGFCLGIIVGLVLAAVAQNKISKRDVQSGFIAWDGKMYRLLEVSP